MGHVGIHRLLLVSIVAACFSQQPQIQAIAPSNLEATCGFTEGEGSVFDEVGFQTSLFSQPLFAVSGSRNCELLGERAVTRLNSPQSSVWHLRGPPRFLLS